MDKSMRTEALLKHVEQLLESLAAKLEGPRAGPLLLSYAQAGKVLACSPSKVKGLVKAGQLRTVLVGRRKMVPVEEVDRVARGGRRRRRRTRVKEAPATPAPQLEPVASVRGSARGYR